MDKKNYEYKDVYSATLEYFNGDDLAASVWISKYCMKETDDNGKIIYHELTPDDMHHRLAHEFYRAGLKYNNPLSEQAIYETFKDFKYIVPQGRPMAGIGIDDAVSISNCFVVGKPNQDSYGTIALIDQQIMQISKRGGGVGTDLSRYRPNGSKVHNAAMTSSGPIDICANRFSNTIREVGQSGRRGALLMSMSINHPDAERFMDCKMEEGKITGANISLKLYDKWISEALDDNNPDKEKRRLWNKIIHNATAKAEPGVLFWDTILRESVADCYKKYGFETTCTNPCGEIPLCPYDSCRLMLLNLYSYVINPYTDEAHFDYKLFTNHARMVVKLMDNMIDLEMEKIGKIINKIESDPEDNETKEIELNLWREIREMCVKGRRSGIGITGEGDMIAAMGLKYGTAKATSFATEIQRILALNCYIESCDLVQIEGREPFKCFDYEMEKNNPFLLRLSNSSEYYSHEFSKKWKYGRRNIALLTISPAGSVSIMTQTTSGIEPLFMVRYKRRRKIDKNDNIKPDFVDKNGDWFTEYNIVHNKFTIWYSIYKGISFKDAKYELEVMSDDEFEELIKYSPYYQATAEDCNWLEKVNMQGNMQKYIDHSISVTVNLPKGTTEELVSNVYETAWKTGCKGCTIYVDGSRDGVLINDKKKEDCHCNDFIKAKIPSRPKSLPCKLIRFSNNKEKWIAAVGLYEDNPYEIFTGLQEKLNISSTINEGFITKEKCTRTVIDKITGEEKEMETSCYYFHYKNDKGEDIVLETPLSETFNEEYWNYAKMVSGLLQGIPLHYAIKIIKSLKLGDDTINTWKNGVLRALRRFLKDEETDDVCPECGAKLWRISGCIQCQNCGYSKCN